MVKLNICFDFDGTLVDSEKSILDCLDAVLKLHHIALQKPLSTELIGPPLQELFKSVTNISSLDRLATLMDDFKKIYDGEAYKSVHPYEGINDILIALRNANHHLSIATNKRISATHQIISNLRWEHIFEKVTALNSKSPSFRDKKELIAFLAATLTGNKIVYVGDKSDDFTAANENEISFIGVSWGYGNESFKKSNEFPVIHTPFELFRQLEVL